MHLDPNLLRNLVIVLFLVALFGGKIAKGKSRATADGLLFPMKPVFTGMRFFALPLYYGFFFYWYWQEHHTISWPMTVLLAAFIVHWLLMAMPFAPGANGCCP